METNNEFLPQDYTPPKGGGNYMKLEKGENRFRILSKPILGWEDWKDNKPIRFRMTEKPSKPVNPEKQVKHFWAFVVWDVKSSAIKILQITQSSIQSAITSLTKDADWGSPFEYDIKVNRTGDGMETEYNVTPAPKTPVSEEAKQAYAKTPVVLEKLFTGDDPFAVELVSAGEESDNLPF